MKKVLIIQTAFIGDVVLATSLIESIYEFYEGKVEIDFLLRKGNEALLENHPKLKEVIIWDKKKGKYRQIFNISKTLSHKNYDELYTLQRFISGGIFTLLINAGKKVLFKKNPLSFLFRNKVVHEINNGKHEIERNFQLFKHLHPQAQLHGPKLYPSEKAYKKVLPLKSQPYICIAPNSVWKTKELPEEKWMELIRLKSEHFHIFLIGGPADFPKNEKYLINSNVKNISGQLNFLESAALMADAKMNYVNDSGPLHFASAMQAPVTAFFCSTTPLFGFGPTNENGKVVESLLDLSCKPCGLHGKKECPLKHFNCGWSIEIGSQC